MEEGQMKYLTVQEHNEFVRRMEAANQYQDQRLTKLEGVTDQIYDISSSVKELAQSIATQTKELAQQREELTHQSNRLNDLERAPGKNWTTLQTGIISAIAAAIGCGLVAMIAAYIK